MASNIVNPPFPQQSGSAPYFGVRAWVNFNGTGTVSIRASGNVSSVTDNNTGDYTINFTTAMPNANFAVSASSNYGDNSYNLLVRDFTTTSVRVQVVQIGVGLYDAAIISIIVLG
jgi:hypothetical protein